MYGNNSLITYKVVRAYTENSKYFVKLLAKVPNCSTVYKLYIKTTVGQKSNTVKAKSGIDLTEKPLTLKHKVKQTSKNIVITFTFKGIEGADMSYRGIVKGKTKSSIRRDPLLNKQAYGYRVKKLLENGGYKVQCTIPTKDLKNQHLGCYTIPLTYIGKDLQGDYPERADFFGVGRWLWYYTLKFDKDGNLIENSAQTWSRPMLVAAEMGLV